MIDNIKNKNFDFDALPSVKPVNIYFDEVITKLMEKTTFFQGLAKEIVFKSLQKIREVPKGSVLIEENSRGCDFFYLLLKGELGIYEKDVKIAQINGVQIFGEIGFFNGKRIATVLTEEKSYVVKITRDFVEELSPQIQSIFYQNIAKELAVKVSSCNEQYAAVVKESGKKVQSLKKQATNLSQGVRYDITRNL